MNITRHARERWEQRVNPKAGDNAEEQIRKAFESSEYIWGMDNKLYYINSDHWIFVVDEEKKNIITVYEVDYGFPSDLNKLVANDLLSRIASARIDRNKEVEDCEGEVVGIKDDIRCLETERGQLINQVNTLESMIKAKKHEKEIANQRVKDMDYEIEKLVNQLVRSRDLRK